MSSSSSDASSYYTSSSGSTPPASTPAANNGAFTHRGMGNCLQCNQCGTIFEYSPGGITAKDFQELATPMLKTHFPGASPPSRSSRGVTPATMKARASRSSTADSNTEIESTSSFRNTQRSSLVHPLKGSTSPQKQKAVAACGKPSSKGSPRTPKPTHSHAVGPAHPAKPLQSRPSTGGKDAEAEEVKGDDEEGQSPLLKEWISQQRRLIPQRPSTVHTSIVSSRESARLLAQKRELEKQQQQQLLHDDTFERVGPDGLKTYDAGPTGPVLYTVLERSQERKEHELRQHMYHPAKVWAPGELIDKTRTWGKEHIHDGVIRKKMENIYGRDESHNPDLVVVDEDVVGGDSRGSERTDQTSASQAMQKEIERGQFSWPEFRSWSKVKNRMYKRVPLVFNKTPEEYRDQPLDNVMVRHWPYKLTEEQEVELERYEQALRDAKNPYAPAPGAVVPDIEVDRPKTCSTFSAHQDHISPRARQQSPRVKQQQQRQRAKEEEKHRPKDKPMSPRQVSKLLWQSAVRSGMPKPFTAVDGKKVAGLDIVHCTFDSHRNKVNVRLKDKQNSPRRPNGFLSQYVGKSSS